VFQNWVLREIFGGNRVEVNVRQTHCTVAAVWLPLFHITFPPCLSLSAECHMPLGGHSFRCSSVPLLHGHVPGAQYVLHVTLVWTFAHPPSLMNFSVLQLSVGS